MTAPKVGHGGIGSQGPSCPICDSGTVWLSEIESVSVYYQCRTCRKTFEFYQGKIVWWPNDAGVKPPLDGIEAISRRRLQPRKITIAVIPPPKKPKSYSIRVKEMTDR